MTRDLRKEHPDRRTRKDKSSEGHKGISAIMTLQKLLVLFKIAAVRLYLK